MAKQGGGNEEFLVMGDIFNWGKEDFKGANDPVTP